MESPFEPVAKKLAWESDTRKSVEIRVRTEITKHHPNPGEVAADGGYQEHYIETTAGKRLLEFAALKSGDVVRHSEHFGDGTKYAAISTNVKDGKSELLIHIKRSFWTEEQSDRRQLPAPLLYLYVGREPLHKALPRAEYLGKHEVMGRQCNAFLFPQVRWAVPQDQVFYLDEATSIPLKVESFRDKAARAKHETMWVWSAESLEKVRDHFVVMKSSMVTYDKNQDASVTWKTQVESVEFDKDYPSAMFWPKFQPGAYVLDGISGKSYQVPDEKATAVDTKKSTASQPIQAVPPDDWSASAPGIALGLGCSILLAGGILWRRNRGTAR